MKYIRESEASPPEDTDFWCNCCDGRVVKASDKSTGKFFLVAGHVWNGTRHPEPIGGDYPMIIFALCPDCLD